MTNTYLSNISSLDVIMSFLHPDNIVLQAGHVIISTFIGVSILVMERNVNAPTDQEGLPNRKKLSPATILWFPISQAILPESN